MQIIQTDKQKPRLRRLIQWGNSKLSTMLMFNIPASMAVCGRICKGCYSFKAYRIYPNVLPAQESRYQASLEDNFVDRVCAEISRVRKSFSFFRVHASAGEFYSQEYVDKWYSIAKRNPDTVFYAYTKRVKDFNFEDLSSLPNFVLINSLQYKRLNYGPISKAPKGSFICPDQRGAKIVCGVDCTYCMSKDAETAAPYFKEH